MARLGFRREWPLVSTALLACALLGACTTTTTRTTGDGVTTTQKTEPANTAASARNRARARVELASGYYRNGQMAVALEEARRAVQIDPTLPDAYGLLGLIYMDLDDRRSAEENFQRALQLDGNNPDLNNNYGWYLCQTGRERESIGYFQRALRDPLYATPARANLSAGVCMMRVKDYAGAEPFLRRSFELDAGNPTAKYELTRLYLATNQTDRAAFYYGLLSKSVDASAETLWLGLRVARAQGDLRTETRLASELRTRFPNSKEAAQLARGAFDE
jgi:type IV pilus assembly protein PilF